MMNLGAGGPQPGAIHDLIHDVRWTGDEIRAEVDRRARRLSRHVGEGDNLFVIAHANSPSFFADLLAVWEVGACAVCVNAGLSASELQNVVEFTQPRAVLVDADSQAGLDVPILDLANEKDVDLHVTRPSMSLGSPALILFTSGTSGDPKGVVHTFRSIFARIALNQAHIARHDLTRTLCTLPSHFGHGLIGNCLTPLLMGCDIFLASSLSRFPKFNCRLCFIRAVDRLEAYPTIKSTAS